VPISIDARVIAATNQNLAERVRQRQFRQDLFFRLNVVTLELAPLRDRRDDILPLAEHFLSDFCARAARSVPPLTAAARRRLLQHSWPGNVRELRNLMERLAYLSQGDKVDADELAFIMTPDEGPAEMSLDLTLSDATQRFQADFIRRQIESADGNITDAARRMGLHRTNLYRKMRQLDIPTDESP
jgi:Nif-specific regulatory protein